MVDLILLRHGESIWNKEGRFTGWVDVPLTEKGSREASHAGNEMHGKKIDVIFTSVLFRAIMTALLVGSELSNRPSLSIKDSLSCSFADRRTLNILCSENLNERFYGELQGMVKEKAMSLWGEEQVHAWRRSFYVRPPEGESLFDTSLRVIPFFKDVILPHLVSGFNVLIVAHSNSLRSLIMHLEKISPEDIPSLELPTGIPRYYSCSSEGKISNVN